MTIAFDNDWPIQDCERISTCPYCDSSQREIAFDGVRDWSFHCAPGKWTYWNCAFCDALYLDPRPTEASIGAAYATYYTHGELRSNQFTNMKQRLRNECLSYSFNADFKPRLGLPPVFKLTISCVAKYVRIPFGWSWLASAPKGKFIDVGCGEGLTVEWAKQLGWDAMGVEIDPAAVAAARRKNLHVIEGTYAALSSFPTQFDCIVCAHVLEHVHAPLELLQMLRNALAPGGILLLTLPNASSALRRYFGANWRGLEAPRHISIPSERYLKELLESFQFHVESYADNLMPTAAESYRIQRRSLHTARDDKRRARLLNIVPLDTPYGNDFIKFACTARASDSMPKSRIHFLAAL